MNKMKVLTLLCLAGLAIASRSGESSDSGSGEWYWETGKEYVYRYSGRLLTGIPELADVYSGIGINCTVHIQRSTQSSEDNTFYLSIKDPKYVRVNEKLEPESPSSPSNWRELRLPELTEVTGEYHSILSKPIMFTVSNGEINSAKISKDEPIWSVNFKKALALQFQTKWEMSNRSQEDQDSNRLNQDSSDEDLTYWKVKEESIDGVCENIYEVRELPKYMIVDRPEMVPYPDACREQKYFGLTKTKDVGKCEKRSSFNYFSMGQYGDQLTGNQGSMWSRSSSTRYIACGTRGRLVIQTIINDGELNQNLMGYKTERFVTGTMQILRLQEVREATPVEMPQNLVTLNSMMYEHSTESFAQQIATPLNNMNEEERMKAVQSGRIPEHLANNPEVVRQALPRNFLYGVTPSDVSSEEVKSQLKKYISEIVRELTQGVDTKDKQITSKVMAVSRGFLLLRSKDEISAVYSELKSEVSSNPEDLVTMKNVFFDTVLTSGCPRCIAFIKESILSGELSTAQITNFFIWMPNFVKLPTEELLNSIYELVSNDKIRESKFLYNKAIMSFSTLLNKACISNTRNTQYPVNVFGEFCNPESEIITSKWIPYLVHDLKYSKSHQTRNEIIVSLGLMQHKLVVGELIPFVEGSVEDTTPLNRYLAIHSLSCATASRDATHVVPILFSILSNPAETTTIRIAAFNALMKQNPSMTVMHKIAALSWTTKDEELLKVINIAFFTLSKESELITYDETTLTLPKKAFLVHPLIKKTEGILPSSGTVFSSDRLRNLGVGYNSKTTWISGKSSFIPKDMYTEMTYFMDQFKFTPISVGLRLSGAENLYSQIEKLFEPIESQLNGQQQPQKQEVNQEWEKVIEQLKLKVRENGPMDGAFFLRWFESSPMFYNFDKMSAQQLREKIAPLLSNPQMIKQKLCGEFPLNFQQTMDRDPNIFMIPSDMGFPIVIEVVMPVAFSVRGSLNIRCESEVSSISLKANVVANSQYSGWVGTSIPFTQEYTVTGVQEEFVMNIPAKIEMNFDIPTAKMSVSFKLETGSQNGPTDVLHYHVKPFTTYKRVADLTPLTLTSNIVYIRSNEELKKRESTFGDYLGLSLKSSIETESPYTDLRAFLDIMKLYNNNPLNALRFLWTSPALNENGRPSFRRHQFTLSYDPTSSSTKEIQFDVKIGCGQKVQGQQNVRYHKLSLKNKNQQQQQQQRKNQFKLNPFQVEDQDIESHQEHPRRQQKINQALQKLNVESGHAVSIIYTTTLKGSRPRSWSYIMTVAAGKESRSNSHGVVKSKWNVHLESETSSAYPVKEICIKGEVDMPVLPLWNIEELRSSLIDFRYVNEISFGKASCSESSIKVAGTAKVSHQQKEHSQQSAEAKRCKQQLDDKVPGARLSQACERTRLQAQTVDEVEFRMEYNNVPKEVTAVESKVVEYLKIYLWPYIKVAKSSKQNQNQNQMQEEEDRSSYPVICRVLFHRETPSFDLIINKPDQSIAFSMIRIPYPLNLVFPMKAGRNNAYLALKAVTGSSFTPECRITKESLTTFDNKTLPLNLDDCFHLLSGDCSQDRSFGILARTMKPDSTRRELKVFLGDVALVLTPSERRNDPYFADIRVTIDSEELTMPANTWKSIIVRGQDYGSIFRSSDNVFQLKSTQYNAHFMFDGTRAVIYASNLLKDKLCGICGDFNQQSRDDMTGPSKCLHSRPETHVASYRVPSTQCQELPQQIQRELDQERSQCVQIKEIPTKVIKSLKAQAGKCSVHKHIVVERSGQVCLSKNKVTECQTACRVADGKMVNKNVAFTCLPEGRTAEIYIQKANNGQDLPELRNLETSFESKVEQPKRCVSSILKA